MKRINDKFRDGEDSIKILLYKPFKSGVIEQSRYVRCGGSINNIFCSKKTKMMCIESRS